VMVVVHDLGLVPQHFPETLLLARGAVAWGPTAEVLRPENLRRASRFDEAWHDDAPWCEPGAGTGGGRPPDDGHHHGSRGPEDGGARRDRHVSTPA
jgi:zinc/manganese transport system ATP-binding protein